MILSDKKRAISFFAMGIGLGLFCFFCGDIYLARLCAGLSTPWRNYIKIISRVLSPLFHLLFWSSVYLMAKFRKASHPFFSLSREILYLLLFSLPLVYGMKIVFGRARPELLTENIYGFYFMMHNHHYHSFPSGHAIVATCILAPLLDTFPRFRIGWIMLFLFLSSSRILLNYHYASDIVASMIICYILQFFFYAKCKNIKKRKSDLYNPIS